MIRMSMLRNAPVVCDGKRIGFLQNICLDDAQKRVQALIVSCGLRGKRTALAEDVLSLNGGFILLKVIRKYSRACERAGRVFVRDSSGLLCGYVCDCALDETNMQVIALEMSPGYFFYRGLGRYWIYDYHRINQASAEICVPAGMSSELIGMKEGNSTCAYPR